MTGNIGIALQITGIGMGLVFGAIILLWILIVIIVRITTEKEKVPTILAASNNEERELFEKIAIAAATVAILAEGEAIPHEFPLPATALVSAWQAVMRTDMLKKRGKTR